LWGVIGQQKAGMDAGSRGTDKESCAQSPHRRKRNIAPHVRAKTA
jgi:hypothetical protein